MGKGRAVGLSPLAQTLLPQLHGPPGPRLQAIGKQGGQSLCSAPGGVAVCLQRGVAAPPGGWSQLQRAAVVASARTPVSRLEEEAPAHVSEGIWQ